MRLAVQSVLTALTVPERPQYRSVNDSARTVAKRMVLKNNRHIKLTVVR